VEKTDVPAAGRTFNEGIHDSHGILDSRAAMSHIELLNLDDDRK
jgi:hypothetical protein